MARCGSGFVGRLFRDGGERESANAEMETPLQDGDVIAILPALAGGA